IKIVVYEMDQRGRPVPMRPPSLLGKALPDLKALGINRLPAELTGKRVLVCFWDMNQRPSRHCMTQIAKQIEALKSKGIVVIAVQASKVDQNVLDGWAKKYNIPVSAMVGGDDRKIRFSWGVQSLPWLILTDSQHVVTAEGFRLSELEEIVEAVK
ncbi:MAG: redoxin domain-containing protein, partial [Phycisphaerales bacterium]